MPLIHLIERSLQKIPIVLQGLRRVIQQTDGCFFCRCMFLQQKRNYQPGGRRTDRACQQLFRMGNEVVTGQFAGIGDLTALLKIGIEGPFGSLNTQIIGNGNVSGRQR